MKTYCWTILLAHNSTYKIDYTKHTTFNYFNVSCVVLVMNSSCC